MGLPKNLTPRLIGELNLACDRIIEEEREREGFNSSQCYECIDAGWCEACWQIVTDGRGRIGGELERKGASHG